MRALLPPIGWVSSRDGHWKALSCDRNDFGEVSKPACYTPLYCIMHQAHGIHQLVSTSVDFGSVYGIYGVCASSQTALVRPVGIALSNVDLSPLILVSHSPFLTA